MQADQFNSANLFFLMTNVISLINKIFKKLSSKDTNRPSNEMQLRLQLDSHTATITAADAFNCQFSFKF